MIDALKTDSMNFEDYYKHLDCRRFDSLNELLLWREELRYRSKTLAVASGCFDVFHMGHCNYLKDASGYGDYLLVGINDDKSIKDLKGSNRPINKELDRADVLASLRCVNAVFIYENTAEFLMDVKPDVWVKGSDYTLQTLNQKELNYVLSGGGRVEFSSLIAGLSSSNILSKI